ncbi:MAG: hypothetical protein U9N52_04900 [Campylobacterota bacterium]|nr:hypothetical protein [Campylobacterota bacterium]
MSIKLAKDQKYDGVQAPTLKSVVPSGSSLTPTSDMLVTLGADVTITIDGESIDLLQAFSFVMLKGVTYEFSTSVQLGAS